MQSHEIDYRIIGGDIQVVEVELDPGETVIAEAGAMLYMDEGVEYQTKMGDGSDPNQGFFGKLVKALEPYSENSNKGESSLLRGFLEK